MKIRLDIWKTIGVELNTIEKGEWDASIPFQLANLTSVRRSQLAKLVRSWSSQQLFHFNKYHRINQYLDWQFMWREEGFVRKLLFAVLLSTISFSIRFLHPLHAHNSSSTCLTSVASLLLFRCNHSLFIAAWLPQNIYKSGRAKNHLK